MKGCASPTITFTYNEVDRIADGDIYSKREETIIVRVLILKERRGGVPIDEIAHDARIPSAEIAINGDVSRLRRRPPYDTELPIRAGMQ